MQIHKWIFVCSIHSLWDSGTVGWRWWILVHSVQRKHLWIWKNSVHQTQALNLGVAIGYPFSFPEVWSLKQLSDWYLWGEEEKKTLVGFTCYILKTVRRFGMSSNKFRWGCGGRDQDCEGKRKKGNFRD